ncbi:EamA family transporter [Oscillatoria sp. CS-180]|uniref:DMT family transporter n=1 Tax=Oscillatoria sp. CS-180 TaxID=3021720 RepID=UPI002330C24F|nr:DMT family transporter [Oscillatoria sp. CS-180]MDB9529251.1 EamA family transporter [Oscillatoria sp. CS-180]
MGQSDKKPNNPQDEGKAAREVLRGLSRDLRALQDDLSGQLKQDIVRLEGTKHRLLNDIEILEEEYQSLQKRYTALKSQEETELSRQQLAQQQVWAKRLAQALASHLQSRLVEGLHNSGAINGSAQQESLQHAYQLLSSLDSSLNETLHSLQQDLNSYQSSLSQQINRMHSMEQQGEAILDALVNRLSVQLQTQIARPQAIPSIGNGHGGPVPAQLYGYQQSDGPFRPSLPHEHSAAFSSNAAGSPQSMSAPRASSAGQNSAAQSAKAINSTSAFQKGLIFIILSTLALSFHNVLVGIIGYGGQIFGRIPIEGIFPLNIPNSLMLLWLRMLVVLPLMMLVAGRIYPRVWSDIRQFFKANDKRPLFQVMASGGFLFMSQVLIYKAISDIGPGVAVTLLFMYPLITVPLAWFLFGDRPTPLRGLVMFAITVGIVFTALPRITNDLTFGPVSVWGIVAGLLSSAAFALYLISMQLSFRRFHPVPVSVVQFTTIFSLTSLILIGGSFFGLQTGEPNSYSGLYLSGVLLGTLTLLGYLFNNYGVRLMGAAQASIVASSGPVLTAILAYLITPGEKSTLHFIQWIGVILVTLGVLALSLEKLTRKLKVKKVRS